MSYKRDLTEEYKAWRMSVYRRDGFKCQMPGCTSHSKRIVPHHIKRWADMPSLRYAVTNGITLCWPCHGKVRGREHDFEATFIGIVASKSPDAINFLIAKYGKKNG
jgi:hypothetical protein